MYECELGVGVAPKRCRENRECRLLKELQRAHISKEFGHQPNTQKHQAVSHVTVTAPEG